MSEVLERLTAERPARVILYGQRVTIVPLVPEHAGDLWEGTRDPSLWDYLFDGPYEYRADFEESIEKKSKGNDPLFFAILDRASGKALGYASYMRIEPAHRCIEVGSILYSTALQRTSAATEVMYLMAQHVFEDLGYRRYEWKCNALNEPSRRAALRLGFTFEGIFRQHMIVKKRNRDTAWFAMLDSEWPSRKAAFEQWLDAANFDADGKQIRSLTDFR
jgi:RimJ/RimL family protein N-acetyltransferase